MLTLALGVKFADSKMKSVFIHDENNNNLVKLMFLQ